MDSLPHAFRDPALLRQALTHASTASGEDNERLEFLGDAVLDLIVAQELFQAEPKRTEGEMTELKAWVVSRKVLAEAGRRLGLEGAARVGPGMQERRLPNSVLANLYEAVLGAVYLDAGLEAARAFAQQTLAKVLERVRNLSQARSPKQTLQERCQLLMGAPPTYILLEERGDAHARAFLVAARIGERRFPSAWGRTRKEAESWAAHEALLVLEDEDAARAANDEAER